MYSVSQSQNNHDVRIPLLHDCLVVAMDIAASYLEIESLCTVCPSHKTTMMSEYHYYMIALCWRWI